MTDKVTQALLDEISLLRAKLEETDIYKEIQILERIVARRQHKNNSTEGGGEVVTTYVTRVSPKARPTPISQVKSRVEMLLEGASAPMPTKEIYAKLVADGFVVPGDSPQNNLSAHLSRDDTFVSWGRSGWTLASSVVPDIDGVADIATKYVDELDADVKRSLSETIQGDAPGVPRDLDAALLETTRGYLGRSLVEIEKRAMRDAVVKRVASLLL